MTGEVSIGKTIRKVSRSKQNQRNNRYRNCSKTESNRRNSSI